MSHYLHGTDPREQERLSRLNQLMNERCFAKLCLRKDFKVLDVGSGLGQMTHLISQYVSEGLCLGIERDINQLRVASTNFNANNLEFRSGDALQLPLKENEFGSFDFVHCRFVLEHLSQPNKAVEQMMQSLKSGGKIVLADDDHQAMILFPEPAGFQNLWSAYMDSYVEVGNDPFIGRKLAKILLDCGATQVKNDVVFFGDCAGTSTFQFFVDNLIEVILPSREIMISSKAISEHDFYKCIAAIRDWATIPHASIWYTTCFAEGVKP